MLQLLRITEPTLALSVLILLLTTAHIHHTVRNSQGETLAASLSKLHRDIFFALTVIPLKRKLNWKACVLPIDKQRGIY